LRWSHITYIADFLAHIGIEWQSAMDLYEKLLITGVIIRLADVAPKEEGTEECYEHAAYPVLMEISVHDYNTLMLYLH